MKVIIAGSRDFYDYQTLVRVMEELDWLITHVVSGKARGADWLGERWARDNDIPVMEFPADWKRHGKSAGPIRNRQMLEVADALVAFPEAHSRGTRHMIRIAREKGILIHVEEV